MKKILVLEDNLVMAERLKALIEEVDIKAFIYLCRGVSDGCLCLMENEIDLFLIDIILEPGIPGDSSGLKFVDHIRRIGHYAFTPVIFITSLADSRLYTYEHLHCYRFFEKPFDGEDLKAEIRQCLKFTDNPRKKKKLYFRKDGVIIALNQEEIVYARSQRRLTEVYLKNGEGIRIPYLTLKKFLKEVDREEFIQCSRSMVINREYLDNIDFSNGIISLNKSQVRAEIGIRFKKQLKEIFK